MPKHVTRQEDREGQTARRARPAAEAPRKAPDGASEAAVPTDATREAQAAFLGDERVPLRGRRRYAARVGRVQGNQHLQRVTSLLADEATPAGRSMGVQSDAASAGTQSSAPGSAVIQRTPSGDFRRIVEETRDQDAMYTHLRDVVRFRVQRQADLAGAAELLERLRGRSALRSELRAALGDRYEDLVADIERHADMVRLMSEASSAGEPVSAEPFEANELMAEVRHPDTSRLRSRLLAAVSATTLSDMADAQALHAALRDRSGPLAQQLAALLPNYAYEAVVRRLGEQIVELQQQYSEAPAKGLPIGVAPPPTLKSAAYKASGLTTEEKGAQPIDTGAWSRRWSERKEPVTGEAEEEQASASPGVPSAERVLRPGATARPEAVPEGASDDTRWRLFWVQAEQNLEGELARYAEFARDGAIAGLGRIFSAMDASRQWSGVVLTTATSLLFVTLGGAVAPAAAPALTAVGIAVGGAISAALQGAADSIASLRARAESQVRTRIEEEFLDEERLHASGIVRQLQPELYAHYLELSRTLGEAPNQAALDGQQASFLEFVDSLITPTAAVRTAWDRATYLAYMDRLSGPSGFAPMQLPILESEAEALRATPRR